MEYRNTEHRVEIVRSEPTVLLFVDPGALDSRVPLLMRRLGCEGGKTMVLRPTITESGDVEGDDVVEGWICRRYRTEDEAMEHVVSEGMHFRPMVILATTMEGLKLAMNFHASRRVFVDLGTIEFYGEGGGFPDCYQTTLHRIGNGLNLVVSEDSTRRVEIAKGLQYFGLTTDFENAVLPRAQEPEILAPRGRLNIALVCPSYNLHLDLVRESIEAMWKFSSHGVTLVDSTLPDLRRFGGKGLDHQVDFRQFDAVLIHYTCRAAVPRSINPQVYAALRRFTGFKLLWILDEYEATGQTWETIRDLGIHHVLSVMEENDLDKVYPDEQVPSLRKTSILTGYVPECLRREPSWPSFRDRPNHVVYRARPMHFYYGKLGREKLEIGWQMKAACESRGLPCDIVCDHDASITDGKWYSFLRSGRAMLATESGSNIFDTQNTIRSEVRQYVEDHPEASYEEVAEKFLVEGNIGVFLSVVSPKMFEAVAVGTVLIMYPGRYNGIFEPWKHYIPLERDGSNCDEVFAALEDEELLQKIARTAHREIVADEKYSYQMLVRRIDAIMNASMPGKSHPDLATRFLSFESISLPAGRNSGVACAEIEASYARLPGEIERMNQLMQSNLDRRIIKILKKVDGQRQKIDHLKAEKERAKIKVEELKASLNEKKKNKFSKKLLNTLRLGNKSSQ